MEVDQIIDDYCSAWSEEDSVKRDALLKKVLVYDVTYTDPTVETKSIQELSSHIGRVLPKWPGSKLLRTSRIDIHHFSGRFSWHLEKPDGTSLPEGLDIVIFDSDSGKVQNILGFFGPLSE